MTSDVHPYWSADLRALLEEELNASAIYGHKLGKRARPFALKKARFLITRRLARRA